MKALFETVELVLKRKMGGGGQTPQARAELAGTGIKDSSGGIFS